MWSVVTKSKLEKGYRLFLHRMRRHQKLTLPQFAKRRDMCRYLINRSMILPHLLCSIILSGLTIGIETCWYRTSAGSPWMAMFTTGDKAFIESSVAVTLRKNCVLYDSYGGGAPEQWESVQAQFEPKVMALNIIWGRNDFSIWIIFQLLPHRRRRRIWSLLHKEQTFQRCRVPATPSRRGLPNNPWVFGGQEVERGNVDAGLNLAALKLFWTLLIKDGATVHTERSVMAFLDRLFGRRVLSARYVWTFSWLRTNLN